MDKLNVELKDGAQILEVREGSALQLREPRIITISGTLPSVYEWMSKRETTFVETKAHILVDREEMSITAILDDGNYYATKVQGSLIEHPIIAVFGINTGNYRTPYQMADTIKMNRTYFENRQVAMELVSQLKTFKAKIEKEIENTSNSRGDKKHLVDQVVNSNIPDKFKLNIPVFKGDKPNLIEVEVYFNADDLTCTLMSPELNDLIVAKVDEAIDFEIDAIKKHFTKVAIIEI